MEWDRDLRLYASSINLLGESGLEMKDCALCPSPSTWSGGGRGGAERICVHLVILSKENESSVEGSRRWVQKVSLQAPSFFSGRAGHVARCCWRAFLTGTHVEEPQATASQTSVCPLPLSRQLMKMQILIHQAGCGAWSFCVCNKFPGDADCAGQGESHFYSKAFGQSEWAEIGKCHLSGLMWHMVKKTACMSKRLSFKFLLCRSVCYWATLGFTILTCTREAWAFLEIGWDNITCNILSQAQRK